MASKQLTPAQRKATDAKCLQCIELLDVGAPVAEVMKVYAEAGLQATMPLTVDAHPREQLDRAAACAGVAAASALEAALATEKNSTNRSPLIANDQFRLYMALRLQMLEGDQVSNAALHVLAAMHWLNAFVFCGSGAGA